MDIREAATETAQTRIATALELAFSIDMCIRRLSDAELIERCKQFEAADCGMAWLLKLTLPALLAERTRRGLNG